MLIRKDILLTAIMTLLAIQGCTEDEMTGGNTRWCEVEASFEETLTRVGLSTMENSRNLVAKWQEGDQMNVILYANDKYYEVGPVPVREISNDGRSCKFSYRLPENFKEPSDGYQLMCFTSNCQPKIIDNEVYYNGSLIRKPISQFKASVMSDEHASSGVFQSNFRHYYTYELLHISNKSDKDIDFALCAYSADLIWYRTLCAVRNWDGRAIYPSEAAQAAIEESPTVKIPANGSDIIVSAYIPNGQLIKNAQMTAKINGEHVHTSNLLSSDKELERGHAYHMYATWDGTELKFDKGGDSPQNYPVAEAIDLGLPSGTKWASWNVGASKPEDYGSYFAWGETEEKSSYTWDNYMCSESACGNPGDPVYDLVGNKADIAGTKFDAATIIWGTSWNMPTAEQIEELASNCYSSLETIEGVPCRKLISRINGNEIIFPLAGAHWYEDFAYEGTLGYYWSSTLRPGGYVSPGRLIVREDSHGWGWSMGGENDRFCAFPIRPVVAPEKSHGCPDDHHPHLIDLGLPSGTLWACCNVGSTAPEEYGGYYAWGETETKDNYSWSTYKWCGGGQYSINKYCYDYHYGIIDNILALELADDAAYVNWGAEWRMPTKEQQDELRNNCEWEWSVVNDVPGMKVKSRTTENCIFLPAAGFISGSSPSYAMTYGYYQSASLDLVNSDDSYYFYFNSQGHYWQDFSTTVGRDVGFSVRPVGFSEYEGLIDNGDFSSGTDGFSSDYVYVSETGNYALVEEGRYTIGTSPRDYHIDFIVHGDHTTGTGNMLIVNGSIDNSKYVWKKKFNVQKGMSYEFSAWFLNVCKSNVLDKNMIEYNINGIPITGAYDITENGWDRFKGSFTATETGSIEIKIRSKSPEHGGNDFAIDDIYFSHLHSFDE